MMTETPNINVELLKSILEGLAQPATLNDHPLANSQFVREYLSRRPVAQPLAIGRALGWALAEVWLKRFLPPTRAAKLKRQWNTFLVLEVGFFFPFRQGRRLPIGLPQISALLADREHLALVLADGNEHRAEELLSEESPDFWEMLTPSNKKDALVLGASAILARRDAALRELAKVLHELESAPNEATHAPISAPSAPRGELSDANLSPTRDALEIYRKNCLPTKPAYVPREWQDIVRTSISTPRVIIQGQAGSGKTALMHILAHELQRAGYLPLAICLADYAPLASQMDVLHFAATRGPFGLACRDTATRDNFEQALAAAEQADQLIVLADQGDDVFEYEQPDLAPRLDIFRRLIITERVPRLMVKRESATRVPLPDLSDLAFTELLTAVNMPQVTATRLLEEFDRAAVDLTPALAVFAAQRPPETDAHPVVVLSRWIDQQLKETRPTGQIIAEVDKARRLLRYLAGTRYDIAPHPESTTRLTRENVRRAFWSLPLQLNEEDQGWRLIDLGCRSGLLSQVKDDWVFGDAAVERGLAAEYASEETTWVSLQPQYRLLMKWTAALVARRGTPQRQQVFFNQLRSALHCAAPLSALDAAEFVTKFNQLGSSAAEAFKAELSESLKRLMQSESSQVRGAAEQRRQLLSEDTNAVNGNGSRVKACHIESLETETCDLAGVLHQLGIAPPTDDESRWLDDRRVLNALLDGLSQSPATDLKRHCAAWLQRADLSKRVELQFHARVPWKSRSRSVVEVVAGLALDPDQTDETQALAQSILATDDHLLRLWQINDAYTPLVYELLLALDRRLMLVPTTPGRHEWRIVD